MMGRAKRERRERVIAGDETPMADARHERKNPQQPSGMLSRLARKAIALTSRRVVVDELMKGSTADTVERLGELVGEGTVPERSLKQAITKKAPRQMDQGIDRFIKEGTPVTVENLLAEARSEPGFLAICERVGLAYSWFEALARERMRLRGIDEQA